MFIHRIIKTKGVKLLIEFVKNPIDSDKLNDAFLAEYYRNAISRIRVGHVLASLVFALFVFFDLMIISDIQLYYTITFIRLIIIVFVLLPFYLLTFTKNIKKYIQPALFVCYLIYGGFLIFTSVMLHHKPVGFVHNFVALLVTIIGLFLLLSYKIRYTFLLSIILIIGYNTGYYINNIGLGQFNYSTHFALLFDLNIWFFSTLGISLAINQYFNQLSRNNYLTRVNLIKQQKLLAESDQVKNKFISIISHDLRNSISSQYSLTDYISKNSNEISIDKQTEMLSTLSKSAYRTLEMFDELVLWSKAQNNRINIEPKQINLQTITLQVLELLSTQLTTKSITINNLINAGQYVFADENSLKTILRNIIGNAIKFSPHGSVIEIKSIIADKHLIVKTKDFGVGIDIETYTTLFNVDKTISRNGTNGERGTGLGLLLCKELLKLNKGRIWVESKTDIGTTVYFSLPVDNN